MPRPAPRYHLLDRGVWQAPWCGADGEVVLLAITSRHRLAVPPVTLPLEASRVDAAGQLWDTLEELDPSPANRHLQIV